MLTREELADISGVILAERLVYGADIRICAWPGCKASTRWRKPRQPKHGTCLDHALPQPPRLSLRDLRRFMSEHFPGAVELDESSTEGEPVEMIIVRTYARDPLGLVPPFITTQESYPPEAGPCQLCGTYIRRGGYGGRKVCRACAGVAS